MATYNLNLNSSDFAKEVLSYYIWGQDTQPPVSKIASSKWIGRKDGVTLQINSDQFLNKIGNAVNAKDFKLLEVFFSGKTKGGNSLDREYFKILLLQMGNII